MDTPRIKKAKLYRSVKIASVGTVGRGKHHDLKGIVSELKTLKQGSALEIPLSKVDGAELANLWAAVHRAAAAGGVSIQTQADEKSLYVWINQRRAG